MKGDAAGEYGDRNPHKVPLKLYLFEYANEPLICINLHGQKCERWMKPGSE